MTSVTDMESVIEAILFVANDPVPRAKLLEVFPEREHDEAKDAMERVVRRYSGAGLGGIIVDEVAGGLRLVSRPDLHGYLRRFFEVSGSNKLSMPALETLAIVAYRQPVTSPEINELRGVSSQGVLKTLLERRLIRIAGRKEVVGKPFLYATTRDFLMHFGLRSLKELPPLEDFEEMFGGDTEASAEPEPADSAEQASLEDAALEAGRDELEARRDAEADEQERLDNELMELPVDADAPDADFQETDTHDSDTYDTGISDAGTQTDEQNTQQLSESLVDVGVDEEPRDEQSADTRDGSPGSQGDDDQEVGDGA